MNQKVLNKGETKCGEVPKPEGKHDLCFEIDTQNNLCNEALSI